MPEPLDTVLKFGAAVKELDELTASLSTEERVCLACMKLGELDPLLEELSKVVRFDDWKTDAHAYLAMGFVTRAKECSLRIANFAKLGDSK